MDFCVEKLWWNFVNACCFYATNGIKLRLWRLIWCDIVDECTWWMRWCCFNASLSCLFEIMNQCFRRLLYAHKNRYLWFASYLFIALLLEIEKKHCLFSHISCYFIFQFVNNTWFNPLFGKSMSCYFADQCIQPSRSSSSAASSSLGVKCKLPTIACFTRSKCP